MRVYSMLVLSAASVFSLVAAGPPASDPLDHASSYSLFISKDGSQPQAGYFPIGFIGKENQQETELGANLVEDIDSNGSFMSGDPITAGEPLPYGNQYFSMAWAFNPLRSKIQYARDKGKLPLVTKYGSFPPPEASDQMVAGKNPYSLIFDPRVQQYLTDFVTEHAKVRGSDPHFGKRVQFWGLDNEWEGAPDYSDEARTEFSRWLKNTYGDISGLNEAWQQHNATFEEASQGQLPDSKDYQANPGCFLDLWNFESDYFTRFLSKLGETLYTSDPLHRGVIHKATQHTIEMPSANRRRTFDQAEFAELMRPYSGGYLGNDVYGAGDRETYEVNFLYNAIRPADRKPGYGVLLTEANNHGGPGHQFASTFWRLLANGLKGVDFFTIGYLGAVKDWSQFGFIDPATGAPRDKLLYAARWIQMVHRTEAFWSQSVPAEGMPRVAILMPRRDVLLSTPNPPQDMWAYPEDHRWKIMRWLCEQGYWVDVIPYQKLTANYLKSYQGLFLIGAEHLTVDECQQIGHYAKGGGVVIADAQVGYFDEHHRVRNQLNDLLGVRFTGYEANAVLPITLGDEHLEAKGMVSVTPVGATSLATSPDGGSNAFLNKQGLGRVLYFPFVLGSLENKTPIKLSDQIPEGPTADSEEYVTYPGEFTMGHWLGKILKSAGLSPATVQVAPSAATIGKLRIEQPMVDANGNCALVVSNRAQNRDSEGKPTQEILPPQTVEITMPPGTWDQALWASAENSDLISIPVHQIPGGKIRLELPQIATAGVCYFFRNHPPLLAIAPESDGGEGPAITEVRPGKPLKMKVLLFNTTAGPIGGGAVRVRALNGWQVEPAAYVTSDIPKSGEREFEFTVTPPRGPGSLQGDWLYPLVAVWNDGQKDASIFSMSVMADPDTVPSLLSDNREFPDTYPHLIHTGVIYSYLAPDPSLVADPIKKGAPRNTALLGGFGPTGRLYPSRGDTQTLHAKYDAPSADIVFDLQSIRQVMRISLFRGPSSLRPSHIKVMTSEDGRDYVSQSEMVVPEAYLSKLDMPPFDAQARYVRLQVDWPQAGGILDQVEIWGR